MRVVSFILGAALIILFVLGAARIILFVLGTACVIILSWALYVLLYFLGR